MQDSKEQIKQEHFRVPKHPRTTSRRSRGGRNSQPSHPRSGRGRSSSPRPSGGTPSAPCGSRRDFSRARPSHRRRPTTDRAAVCLSPARKQEMRLGHRQARLSDYTGRPGTRPTSPSPWSGRPSPRTSGQRRAWSRRLAEVPVSDGIVVATELLSVFFTERTQKSGVIVAFRYDDIEGIERFELIVYCYSLTFDRRKSEGLPENVTSRNCPSLDRLHEVSKIPVMEDPKIFRARVLLTDEGQSVSSLR